MMYINNNSNSTTISKYDIVIWCILLTLITSILRDILFEYINWLFGGSLLFFLTIILVEKKKKISILILIFSIIGIHLIFTHDISREIKDSMNWLCAIEFLMICSDANEIERFQKKLYSNQRIIKLTLYMYLFELILILLSPSAYMMAWGSGKVFTAYNAVQGTAANCCLFIALALYYIGIQKNAIYSNNIIKNYWVILIGVLINIYAILLTQVRAVLFAVLAMSILFVMMLFSNNFKRILSLFFIGIIGIIVLLNNESFRSKMMYSEKQLSYSGFSKLDALLSSRPIIWKRLLTHFFQDNSFVEHIVGAGFYRVYDINAKYGSGSINAHSDIVHTLVGAGLIGLIIMMSYVIKIVMLKGKERRFSVFVLILYILIPLIINGIMMTPSHVYSIIFIITILKELQKKKTRQT